MPAVAILLPLRGADPKIRETLEMLSRQTYSNYDVFVMMDHEEDSGLPLIQEILRELDPQEQKFHLSIRQVFYPTTSLKVNCLLDLYSRLEPHYEILAGIDGDVIPHPEWLAETVAPLLFNPEIGAATGYRWYHPEACSFGENIRYLFNAVSWVWICFGKYIWGGTYAIRRNLVCSEECLERLKSSPVEDSEFTAMFVEKGLKNFAVPPAMMENQEKISLKSAYFWIGRQILWNYLCLRKMWFFYVLMVWGLIAFQIYFAAAAIMSLVECDWFRLGLILMDVLVFWGGNLLMLLILERKAQRCIQIHHPEHRFGPGLSGWFKIILSMPLTLFMVGAAAVQPVFLRSFCWRGITYRIFHHGKIHIVDYEPYRDNTQNNTTLV